MKTVKLLKQWEQYPTGSTLEVDENTAKDLIEQGAAVEYDEAAERQKVKELEEHRTMLQQMAKAAVAAEVVAQRPKIKLIETSPQSSGFKAFHEFAHAVQRAGMPGRELDPRLKVAGHLEIGDDSQGGYLVPDEFRAELLRRAYEVGAIMSRCRQVPLSSNAVSFPTVAETSRATGSRFGAVRAYWVDEVGEKHPSKPLFGKIRLELNKLAGLVYASDELLEDSAISMQPLLVDLFSQELTWTLENAIINGTGAGQPLGILASGCLVTQGAQVGQAANTIVAQNIVNMWSRLWARSRPNAVWLIDQSIEPQLFTMSLAVGTGGIPVYMPANGLSAQPYGTLLGRPVIPVEHCAALGTVGDIILADLSQYLLATKSSGIQVASSIHLKFDYDETAFRFVMRVDGQPWWQTALTPASGGANQGPFVVLATRP